MRDVLVFLVFLKGVLFYLASVTPITFNYIDVGDFGSNNDSGVHKIHQLAKPLQPTTLVFLTHNQWKDALKTWLMRSFPGRSQLLEDQQIFNYHLSRARQVIENAFEPDGEFSVVPKGHQWRQWLRLLRQQYVSITT